MDIIRKDEGAIEVDGRLQFSDGDPSPSGHPPTRITARYLNSVMNELVGLVQKSGQSLNPSSEIQLFNAVKRLSRYSDYDAIVGDENFGSIPEAIQSLEGPGKILVLKDQIVTETILVDKPDITISSVPGVIIHGLRINEPIFRLDAANISIKDLRMGAEEPGEGTFAFSLSGNARSALAVNVRIYGFSGRPYFSGDAPLFQSGVIVENE